MARQKRILTVDELMVALVNAYGKQSNVLNAAIRKAYAYAQAIESTCKEEKETQLALMLNHNHRYVRYWGAVIALSHKVLKKQSLIALLAIIDENVREEDGTEKPYIFTLKLHTECVLYDYKKYGCIGSYPGHYDDVYSPSILPNANRAIRYFRRYVEKEKKKEKSKQARDKIFGV